MMVSIQDRHLVGILINEVHKTRKKSNKYSLENISYTENIVQAIVTDGFKKRWSSKFKTPAGRPAFDTIGTT